MKFTRKIGVILLSIFLILYGLIAVAGLVFSNMNLILGGLAIAAGIFLLIER